MVQLSPEILTSLVRAHFDVDGFEPSFRRISTGKFNVSYFVRLPGREVVLRIAPPPGTPMLFYEQDMMRQEPQIHAIVRERTSVPVARVLAVDFSRQRVPTDYLFMEKLPGTAASASALTRAQWGKAIEQVGRYLRQVHEITADSYGYLGDHHPMEPQSVWAEAFAVMWRKMIEQIVGMGAYTAEQGEWLLQAFEARRRYFERDVPSCLLHMDIWSQNILLDSSANVTGIVDWDRALWGDPEIEFAVLDYCGISEPEFWRGYGREREWSDAARIRHHFYLLYEHQKYIVIRGLRNGRWGAAMRYRDECLALARRWFG